MYPSGRTSRPSWKRAWLVAIGVTCLVAGVMLSLTNAATAQSDTNPVYVAYINGTIDLGLAPYLSRVVDEAEAANASALLLEINTPGGRLDAALQMRQTLLDAGVPTIAYVNREAFSAGALIAVASQQIYMAQGAVIGAATPVTGTGETADEKVISAVRKTFRSTAETRGRDPQIAEAMVDPAVQIDGVIEEGKLLTLTTDEAMNLSFVDGVATNQAELLDTLGLGTAEVVETSPALAERLVRFLNNPIIASLLTSLGFLLILVDIYSGGIGMLSIVGVAMFVLFLWGNYIAGLAGWESVVLLLVGIALIALEVFVVPGFGVAGVFGLAALLGGVYLTMVGGEIVTTADLERGVTTVGLSLLLILVGVVLVFWLLPRAGRFNGLVLQTQLGRTDVVPASKGPVRFSLLRRRSTDPISPPARIGQDQDVPSLVGLRGRALSNLRPGGIADINGERVDVVTQGDYIRAGEPIIVIADERYRRVVQRDGASTADSTLRDVSRDQA